VYIYIYKKRERKRERRKINREKGRFIFAVASV
jgi:hypothetical protein